MNYLSSDGNRHRFKYVTDVVNDTKQIHTILCVFDRTSHLNKTFLSLSLSLVLLPFEYSRVCSVVELKCSIDDEDVYAMTHLIAYEYEPTEKILFTCKCTI